MSDTQRFKEIGVFSKTSPALAACVVRKKAKVTAGYCRISSR